MKNRLMPGFVLAFLTATMFISCGKRDTPKEQTRSLADGVEIIKFDPEGAVDFPFDSLFKSVEAIGLLQTKRRDIELFVGIERVDSFIIINGMNNFRLFDLNGRFIRRIEMPGNDPDDIKNLTINYADNESITSIYGQNWVKFSLDGSVLGKGKITNELNRSDFIPLEDSLWLFYSPYYIVGSDTLRLWTSDQNFNIKKKFHLGSNANMSGNMTEKYIHKTLNGIYITDLMVDTVYKFTETEAIPIYAFDFGNFKYRRGLGMGQLDTNEIAGKFKLVTSNAVLFEVVMNNTKYIIYYDRDKKISRTIKSFGNEFDPISTWSYMGSDQNDRLYWMLPAADGELIEIISKKYNYPDLLDRKKGMEGEVNVWVIITSLR